MVEVYRRLAGYTEETIGRQLDNHGHSRLWVGTGDHIGMVDKLWLS